MTILFFVSSCASFHRVDSASELVKSKEKSQEKEEELLWIQLRTPSGVHEICRDIVDTILINDQLRLNAKAPQKFLNFKERIWVAKSINLERLANFKRNLFQSLRVWHRNRIPTYYLINDNDIKNISETYAQVLKLAIDSPRSLTTEDKRLLDIVNAWVKTFGDFPIEIEQLLDERISLQYNLKILKELKPTKDREFVTLKFLKKGTEVEKTFIFYKDEKNLKLEIANLENELKKHDDTLIGEGKLKDRLIRQAMLKDFLTIVHHEVEIFAHNTQDEKLANEFKELASHLEELLTKPDLQTTSFGIYKLNSKLLLHEILPSTQVENIKNTYQSSKEVIEKTYDFSKNKIKGAVDYAKNKGSNFVKGIKDFFKEELDEEGNQKGFFAKIFAKLKAIDPKKAAVGGATVTLGYIGIEQYFSIKPTETSVCLDPLTEKPIECSPPADRLDNTKQEAEKLNQDVTDLVNNFIANPF